MESADTSLVSRNQAEWKEEKDIAGWCGDS